MFWMLIQIAMSQFPNTNNECLSQYFHQCDFRGQNDENLLFECQSQYTILLPKIALINPTTQFLMSLSQNQWLLDQYIFQLQGGFLTIEIQKENYIQLLYFQQYVVLFSSLRINSSLISISTVLRKSYGILMITLIFIEIDQYQEYYCQLYCDQECKGLTLYQHYNSIRKSLQLVLGVNFSQNIYLIEFSLTDKNFKIRDYLGQNSGDLILTQTGLMILFSQQQMIIYEIGSIFNFKEKIDMSNTTKYLFIKESGQISNYVFIQKQQSTSLFQVNQSINFENISNIEFPEDAFLIADQIVLLYNSFRRVILNLSTGITINTSIHSCQKVNLFYELLNLKDLREFDQSYNEILKKGDTFKWIYHPGSTKEQSIKITGTFDWSQIKQRFYLFSSEQEQGQWKEIRIQYSEVLHQRTSFYFELIFLSDTKVNDLVFTVKETVGSSQIFEILIKKTIIGVIITLFLIFIFGCSIFLGLRGILKMRLWWRTYQLERSYVKLYSFLPSTVKYSETECLICLGQFQINQKVSQTLCGHTFHYQCFNDWMLVSQIDIKCPSCNQKLNKINGLSI